MIAYKMCGKENAIEEIVFALVFEKEFDGASVHKLVTELPAKLNKSLPSSSPSTKVSFNVGMGSGAFGRPENTLSGIILHDNANINHAKWILKADGDSIVLSCREYSRWKEVGAKALELLSECSKYIDFESNRLLEVGTQCTDRFKEDVDNYNIDTIFNVESKYLTKHIVDSGLLWHVHQGWFIPFRDDDKLLSVLNISSQTGQDSEYQEEQSSLIQHSIKLQFNDEKLTYDDLFQPVDGKNQLKKIFDQMHELNKSILLELLNESVLNDIRLKNAI